MAVTKLWVGEYSVTATGEQLDSDYLLKANNLSDLPNRDLARRNLGITVSLTAPVSPQINDLWIDLGD